MQQAAPYDPFYGPPLKNVSPVGYGAPGRPVALTTAAALQALAGARHVPIAPHQMGVLVAGCVVIACWPLLCQRLSLFESQGLQSLAECWVFLWISLAAGRFVQWRARGSASIQSQGCSAAVDSLADVAGQLLKKGDDCDRTPWGTHAATKGAEYNTGKAGDAAFAPAGPPAADDDEDEVYKQKRSAQAAQAAATECSRQAVEEALGVLRAWLPGGDDGSDTTGLADAAKALRSLAELMLDMPQAMDQLLAAGGIATVSGVVERVASGLLIASNEAPLDAGGHSLAASPAPALLQGSWILLQLAHGPPAARQALSEPEPARALTSLLGVGALPPGTAAPDACAAASRNAALAVLVLVEHLANPSVASTPRAHCAAQASEALRAAGALEALSRLVACNGCGGAGPAALAAGALGAIAVGAAGREALAQLGQAALGALLNPEGLHGVVYLLSELQRHRQQQQQQQQQQASSSEAGGGNSSGGEPVAPASQLASVPGSARALALLDNALALALSSHPEVLMRGVVEERLVGPMLSALPLRFAQVLMAHLVSSRGQGVLSVVEREWAVDVPLALAQAMVLPVHLKLPATAAGAAASSQLSAQAAAGAPPPLLLQQQQQRPSGASALLECGRDDVFTDVLAARLLLQASRLRELVAAAGDDWAESAVAAGFAGGGPSAAAAGTHGEHYPDVAKALLALGSHLLSMDTELQRVKLVRGDSVADSESTGNSGASGSGASSSSQTGPGATPGGSSHPEIEPAPEGDGGLDAPPAAPLAPQRSGAGPVVFAFGPHEHRVGEAAFRRLRRASKLMHSVLVRAPAGGEPIRALRVPGLGDEANWWALKQVQQWVEGAPRIAAVLGSGPGSGAGALGLGPRQAAQLWVAADFWQVDELQCACEDELASALTAAAAASSAGPADHSSGGGFGARGAGFEELLSLTLALCSRHPMSCGRLQSLAAQAFLRGAPRCLAPRRAAALVALHQDVLLQGLHDELRDRLVALCVLNVGSAEADSPEEPTQ